ncbi:MAG: TOMM system kinase/cyclase fusion protein [Aquabacterium sp.]
MHDQGGALHQQEVSERLKPLGYALRSPLGAGGYGTVYLATQTRTQRQVAVKLVNLAGDARRLARFHRETALCASLNHPHIVQLLDKGDIDGHVYGVFEYVPGETLKHLICRRGALSASETGQIMMEVLEALDCAHQAGIVHRDLKPDNVMITTTGPVAHAKVLDFGISTVVPQARDEGYADLTMTQEFLGTPAYSAPEQLRGEPPTVKSDLYAWGLMFLECLTGVPVMQGASPAEIYHQQLSAHEISLPPEILNHPVASILRRALRKNPAERSESARSLLRELQQIRLDDLVGTVRGTLHPNTDAMAVTIASKRAFAEKRMVTVLSCGVTVWPGAGPQAMDPEELELLQRQTFDQFCDAATRRGGLLAGKLGDRMLVLFGYPHISDTDARRAGMTAEDILTLGRQQADALLRSHGVHLAVRGGLHTGVVIVSGGETPSGHAVNVALQLENAAQAGGFLVSEEARQALARAGSFELTGQPGLALAPPRTAWALRPPAIARSRIVDDTRASQRRPLGREAEVAALQQAWAKASQGQGQAILLQGEAGIGKSSLVDFMAAQVDNEGLRVLRCQCLPEHQNNALSPAITLLRQEIGWTGQLDAEDAARTRLQVALDQAGCDSEQLLPIFCSWIGLPLGTLAPSQISPQMQKALFVQALGQWLLHHGADKPALVILEDLHWADPTTLEWLTQLAQAWPGKHVLILMTGRPEYAAPADWPLQTVAVKRLGDDEAAALVRQLLAPDQVDDTVVGNVVSRTDGVPLFIQELTRMLRDSQLDLVDGVWRFRLAPTASLIPVSLQDSLHSRFDRLGLGKSLLQLAATIGRQFDVNLLAACAEMSPQALADELNTLREAGLIRPVRPTQDVFEFRHALIRDAAYDCMVTELASEQHGRVAQHLLQLQPQRVAEEPDSVARHFARAGAFDQAVQFGLQQLRITQHRSLNDDTIAYASQVRGWIERMHEAGRLAAKLEVNGYVTQALMNKFGWAHDEVKGVIAESEAWLSDPSVKDKLVPHLWALITYHHVASNRAEVRQLSERLRALGEEMHDENVLIAAHTYIGLAHYSDGQFDEAERLLSLAIDAYRPQVHAHHAAYFGFDTRVWAAAGRALVRWFTGRDADSEQDALQSIAWARELEHIPSLCMALLYWGLGKQARGDKAGAQAVMTELLSITKRYGLPAFEGYAEVIRAWANSQVEVADAVMGVLWQMGCRYCQTYYRAFAADTVAGSGDLPGAIARIDECLAMVGQLDEHMYTAELHLRKARYLQQSGGDAALVKAELIQARDLAARSGKSRTESEARALLG